MNPFKKVMNLDAIVATKKIGPIFNKVGTTYSHLLELFKVKNTLILPVYLAHSNEKFQNFAWRRVALSASSPKTCLFPLSTSWSRDKTGFTNAKNMFSKKTFFAKKESLL